MLVLRCTTRLLGRFKVTPDPAPPDSTTRLGDWYANLLHVGRMQLVLAVSAQTFLPVVIDAAPSKTIVPRIRDAAIRLLERLDVPREALEEEERQMSDVVIARTADRQVVGIMVEFAKTIEWTWDMHPSPEAMSLYLAGSICMPLRPPRRPDDATRLLFGPGALH